MVLYRAELQTVRFQDFIRLLDFGKVVVGHADDRHIFLALKVLRKFLCPLRSAPNVMDPIDIETVKLH